MYHLCVFCDHSNDWEVIASHRDRSFLERIGVAYGSDYYIHGW